MSSSFLCRRRFITTHQESIIHAKGARRGFSSSMWRLCVRMRVRACPFHSRKRPVRACVLVGEGGCSVKIISGFSVRMNFTTVSSHEIIWPDTSNHLRYISPLLFTKSACAHNGVCLILKLSIARQGRDNPMYTNITLRCGASTCGGSLPALMLLERQTQKQKSGLL